MKKTAIIALLLAAVLALGSCVQLTEIEKLDVESAKSIALNALNLSGTEVSYVEATLRERDGQSYYDVTITVDGVDYTLAVDATSGVVIERSDNVASLAGAYIGEAKAFELAHTDAGYTAEQSTLAFWELHENNGAAEYELWFYGISQGYHYTVDARTGEILTKAQTNIDIPGRNNNDIDPEMNVYPLNPAVEEPAMEVIPPTLGHATITDLIPAEVGYPIIDSVKAERVEGITHASEMLAAITAHSGYSRKEIEVLARILLPVGTEPAYQVYFTTPDGKYHYYAVSRLTKEVIRWESADELNDLSHPLRNSSTKVVMPEGMISVEEAFGYALRVNIYYDSKTQTERRVWKDDVILYVAEPDFNNGEYEYDIIYQEKDSGKFADVTVRASDGAIRGFGVGYWGKGYFGSAFDDVPVVNMTASEAKTAALSYVPGAAETDITAFTTDTAEGKMEYEGTITYRGMNYTFEIDAYSGAFRSWNAAPAT